MPKPVVPRSSQPRPTPTVSLAGEGKLYGINACLAFFKHRPDALVRVYLSGTTARRFGEVMRFCAQRRLAYHLVEDADLEKLTQSTHHEGVCFLVRQLPARTPEEWLAQAQIGPVSCVVALEEVGNPHNFGAVMRVAANFGVSALCASDPRLFSASSALRVAEGGAVFLDAVHFDSMRPLMSAFKKAGYCVVATSSHKGENLFASPVPEKALILLGSEAAGLSKAAISSADLVVRIPGTGHVESLNVASAAAVLLADFWRRHHM